MGLYYAYTRFVNSDRDVQLEGTSWKTGSPMAEAVKRIMATPRGKFVPEPDFGIDLRDVNTARSDCSTRFRAAILAALSELVRKRLITNTKVSVEVSGDRLRYDISFYDPRARDTFREKGQI